MVCKYVKGKNALHIVSAEITAGSDFVQELQGTQGSYRVVANPEQDKADCLTLLSAVARQFAQAIRKAR